MADRTFQSLLRDRLDTSPDSRALAFPDRRGNFEWLDFGTVVDEALRYGQELKALGLKPGQACIFVLTSDRACASALLGAMLTGAVPTLVAPPIIRGLHSNLPEVVLRISQQTNAGLVVLRKEDSDAFSPSLTAAGHAVVCIEELGTGTEKAAIAETSADDIIARQLTSGTTGFPKICEWNHERVLASLDGMEKAMDLSSDDIFVNWTPLYHDMGLVNNFFLCLAKSIPLVLLQAQNFVKRPIHWLQTMHQTGATVTWSPNFGFAMTAQRATESDLAGIRLDHVRSFWNAAERIHAESILAFQEKFEPCGLAKGAVKTNFGCAENVGGATFSSPDAAPVIEKIARQTLHDEGIARHAEDGEESVLIVSTGAPYPGMTLRVVDESGETLPDGHVGELALNTPSRMLMYLDHPEETAEAVRGDELFTGDTGYVRNGEFFWTGRVRERINLHGKKYDPSDFEPVLFEVQGLRQGCFAAFGVDDAAIGSQRLVILTEIRDAEDLNPDEIIAALRSRITTEMNVSVSEILLLSQGTMSKTSSGKRRHRFYRELFLAGDLTPVASWKEG